MAFSTESTVHFVCASMSLNTSDLFQKTSKMLDTILVACPRCSLWTTNSRTICAVGRRWDTKRRGRTRRPWDVTGWDFRTGDFRWWNTRQDHRGSCPESPIQVVACNNLLLYLTWNLLLCVFFLQTYLDQMLWLHVKQIGNKRYKDTCDYIICVKHFQYP